MIIKFIHKLMNKLFYDDSWLSEIKNLLNHLDEIMDHSSVFYQEHLHLVHRATKVFNADIYNREVVAEQALIIFTDAIFHQIEIHDKPERFVGLKLAIDNYLTDYYKDKAKRSDVA